MLDCSFILRFEHEPSHTELLQLLVDTKALVRKLVHETAPALTILDMAANLSAIMSIRSSLMLVEWPEKHLDLIDQLEKDLLEEHFPITTEYGL